jgi:FkbM family methyltransferase
MLRKLATTRVFGRRRLQPIFSMLHRVALRGMNFGPSLPATTGELNVVDIAALRAGARVPVIFDVGANTGAYATAVLERLGGRVQLYCFEPSRTAFEQLVNSVGGRAQTFNLALGERDSGVPLYFDAPGSPIASLFPRRLENRGRRLGKHESVDLRRLDDICREAGVSRIDLLKLDVEGNERNVLVGAGALLDEGVIDVIQFEFGGCNVDSRTFLRDFFDLLTPRYQIHRIIQNGLVSLDGYREEDEIFITVNYVAIKQSVTPSERSVAAHDGPRSTTMLFSLTRLPLVAVHPSA